MYPFDLIHPCFVGATVHVSAFILLKSLTFRFHCSLMLGPGKKTGGRIRELIERLRRHDGHCGLGWLQQNQQESISFRTNTRKN